MSKECKHCIKVKENLVGELLSLCELSGEWENITAGYCFYNCEDQKPVGDNANKCIRLKDALAFPFACGQYDKKHADAHFINGCQSYREYIEQLPVVDAIPVDWIINYATRTECDKNGEKSIVFVKNHIDTMLEEWKKADYKRLWIPCSERLPDYMVTVLATFQFQGGNECITTERFQYNGEDRWSCAGGLAPIAWMPLPEPYEGV